MNLYFEDFALGQKFKSPREIVVHEATIDDFARISGDLNRLHVDEAFARATPFQGRIAHGLLGLSLASGMLHEMGIVQESVVAFTALDWKFKGPVRIGDSLSSVMSVAKLRPVGSRGGFVVFKAELLNQKGEIVQKGTWTMMVKRKSAA